MKIIGYNYAAIHIAVHILLASLLYLLVNPQLTLDWTKLLIIAAGTAVVDLDHIPLWMETGVKGYLKLRSVEEFGKPRRYGMHNLIVFLISIGGSLLVLVYRYFLVGLFFTAVSVHLLWDFLEDILIFRMGYGHWI